MRQVSRTVGSAGALLGAVVVVLTAAAGCGGGRTGERLRPVVSATQGRQIAEAYSMRNTAANARRDAVTLGQIETNPLREMSLAFYEERRALKLKAGPPFTFQGVSIYPPTLPHYPHWFVSFARIDGKPDGGDLSVFVQDTASEPWRRAIGVQIGTQSVKPVLRDEVAQPPDRRLSAAGAAATAALADYLGGGRPGTPLEPGPSAADFRSTVRELDRGAAKGGWASARCTSAGAAKTFELGTASGALVLTSLRCRLRSDAGPDDQLTLKGDWRGLNLAAASARRHTVDLVHLVALSVPEQGPAVVLGDDWAPVSVTGS